MKSCVALQDLALLVFPQDFAAHSTPNKSGQKWREESKWHQNRSEFPGAWSWGGQKSELLPGRSLGDAGRHLRGYS